MIDMLSVLLCSGTKTVHRRKERELAAPRKWLWGVRVSLVPGTVIRQLLDSSRPVVAIPPFMYIHLTYTTRYYKHLFGHPVAPESESATYVPS